MTASSGWCDGDDVGTRPIEVLASMGPDGDAVLRGVSGWVHISGLCSQSGRRAALDVPPRDPRRMQERLFLKLLCSVDPIGLQSTAV